MAAYNSCEFKIEKLGGNQITNEQLCFFKLSISDMPILFLIHLKKRDIIEQVQLEEVQINQSSYHKQLQENLKAQTFDMSFKAQLEVLVHFESFRNINLYHQGIYVLRARIYQKIDENTIIHAHPYRIVDFDETLVRDKMKQKYKLSADLYDHYFFSKGFIIKFMDEMVDLDDICHFRAEIDAYPSYNEDNFYFTIDLLFADLATSSSEPPSLKEPDKSGFEVVATFESLLHNSLKGIREYVPVYFTDIYYSQVNLTVHTALINYQFRYIPLKPLDKQKNQSSNPSNSINQHQALSSYGQNNLNPENFEQFFDLITHNCNFIKELNMVTSFSPFLKVKPSEVDDKYNTYVASLRFDHQKFLKHFIELVEKMIHNPEKLNNFLSKLQEPMMPEAFVAAYPLQQSYQKQQLKSAQSPSQLPMQGDQSDWFDQEELNDFEEKKNEEDVSCLNKESMSFDGSTNVSLSQQDDTIVNSKAYYSQYYDIIRICVSQLFDFSQPDQRKRIVNEISKEINELAGCQFILWNQYIELLRGNTVKFTKSLLEEYQVKISDQWGQSIFRYPVIVKELYHYVDNRIGKAHVKQAKQYRKNSCFKFREPLNVEDLNLFPKAKVHPIIFHEIYAREEQDALSIPEVEPLKRDEAHVVVLAHGFQGSSYDLKLFSNNITIRHPEVLFLHSSCNEDNSDGDITQMGIKLSEEVKKFISNSLYGKKLKRISFVGHSLGGLIVRAALPFLSFFEEQFFTFMTFSSPHMGFMFSQSVMVDAGLWFMKAWNKTMCLKQMTMDDTKNPKESFIYNLAFKSGLQTFKHIILVSSPQDQYVPFHSARMQQTVKQSGDAKLSSIYDEMLKEIFGKIQADKIHRLDVSFEIPGKVIDNFIGRAAHIQFLENETLMKMLLSDLKYIFL